MLLNLVVMLPSLYQKSAESLLSLQTTQRDETGKLALVSIAPDIGGFAEAPDWDVDVSINKSAEADNLQETCMEITLSRPLAYVALTDMLLFSLVVFIARLAFLEDVGNFLQVAVGILLGLWGVQSILIPASVTRPVIIQSIILVLYALLAFAVFFRFAIRPAWRWLDTRAKPQNHQPSADILTVHISQDPIEVTIPPQDHEPAPTTPTTYQKATLILSLLTALATIGLLFKRTRKEKP